MQFIGSGRRLAADDFARGAAKIGCEVAALKAVTAVEARGQGFDAKNRPVILPERHVFHRCLPANLRSIAVQRGLAYPAWKPGNYPATQDARYDLLNKMIEIDETAALKAPSWGIGQVLGENHTLCGYVTVQEMVSKCLESEGGQLDVMVGFILGRGIAKHLRDKNWEAFAFAYNGSRYHENAYHTKLAAAYSKIKAGEKTTIDIGDPLADHLLSLGDKGDAVKALQIAIGVHADGDFGPLTEQAVKKFQAEHGLGVDGQVGPRTGRVLGLTFWS